MSTKLQAFTNRCVIISKCIEYGLRIKKINLKYLRILYLTGKSFKIVFVPKIKTKASFVFNASDYLLQFNKKATVV